MCIRDRREREGPGREMAKAHVKVVIPHSRHFAHLSQALLEENPDQACHDVFGITRHTTLASLCRNLESMIEIMPEIVPWSEDKVAALFNKMRGMEVGPDKVMRWHYTLKKLGCLLGSENELKSEYLSRKRDSVRSALCTALVAPDHRAVCPSREIVCALERATTSAPTEALQWVASALRFALGASARVNDCQHCSPQDLMRTDTTAELKA